MTVLNEVKPNEPIAQDKVQTNAPIPNTDNKQTEDTTKAPSIEENPDFRAFREGRKKDRAEREAAEKRAAEKEAEVIALKAAMESAFSKSAPTPQAYQNYYGTSGETEETEDQKIEKKVNELLAKKEKQYQQQQQEREQREYPTRLSRELPDFGSVCSQENLDYLDYHYPELSRPLQRLPEGYDKWHDIYYAVKKLMPNSLNAKKDAQKAEMNSNKPKSISSPQMTPSGEKSSMSMNDIEVRRAENWARMQKTMKGLG